MIKFASQKMNFQNQKHQYVLHASPLCTDWSFTQAELHSLLVLFIIILKISTLRYIYWEKGHRVRGRGRVQTPHPLKIAMH